jgi:hypothetical protein
MHYIIYFFEVNINLDILFIKKIKVSCFDINQFLLFCIISVCLVYMSIGFSLSG